MKSEAPGFFRMTIISIILLGMIKKVQGTKYENLLFCIYK